MDYWVNAPITRERMQYMTDMMQVNIPTPNVATWAPLVIVEVPPFRNGIYAMFMVVRADKPDYNILTGSAFYRDGRAIPDYPIDCGDWEDFHARQVEFEIGSDKYTIYFQITPAESDGAAQSESPRQRTP